VIEQFAEPLLKIHDRIRDAVVGACERQSSEQLAAVVAESPADSDTIYSIDRVGEEIFIDGLTELARREPILLIGEGLSSGALVLPNGASERDCRWRVLIDPIDGTRGLMYQKRSAWILTGVAPNRGASTRLRDIVLAAQTEIPLLKQHLSDQVWAVRGRGVEAWRYDRLSCARERLTLRPSSAAGIGHGFATLVRFFPGARDVLAAIDDDIAQALVPATPGKAGCFEDQYMSTGGQLYELIAGHDRFIADLRPLTQAVRRTRGLPPGLCCHPYDLCTALIAEELGVILTDASGAPADAPFDAIADVAWVGYANEDLRTAIEPVLQDALRRRGLL
jgi:fructose-1,6-bisphosphatase/inositol monophosphatase family enzyme